MFDVIRKIIAIENLGKVINNLDGALMYSETLMDRHNLLLGRSHFVIISKYWVSAKGEFLFVGVTN